MKRRLGILILVSVILGSCALGAAGVELSVIHCWDGARTEWVDELLRAFEERNPDIRVNGVFAGSCATRLPERLILSIASGAPFDVAMVGPGTLASLANHGELLALDDWLRTQRISRDTFLPSELRGAQWEGRLYGLPFTTGDGNLLYYNMRIFEEAGLNSDRPPTTFAELDEISKKLYRVEDGVATLIPFSFAYQSSQAPLWWLYAGGGQFVSEDGSEAHFTDERALEIMDFLRDYINHRVGGPQNIRGTRPAFLASQIAMFTRGNNIWGEVKTDDPDFPLGVGLAPKHPNSQWTGATRGGWYYAVPSSTPHPEEA
ncbi:MAG: ABC transporter substrate-binding protein, partial [Limnochordia bacterium]